MLLFAVFIVVVVIFWGKNVKAVDMWMANHFGPL
jgi:hypothetical protein